jgi:hypothetical protein
MLFSRTQITSLFGLSNEKFIFDMVHHAFKFTVLTFEKGQSTEGFTAAFRINPREAIRVNQLANFFNADSDHIQIEVPLIRKLSPDSLSIMEFSNSNDVNIARKSSCFSSLGKWQEDSSPLQISREFMASDDHHRFNENKDGLTIFEGKMFEQFDSCFESPRWWISHGELAKTHFFKLGDWRKYRLAIRRIASSTNERTFISTIIPPNSIVVHSVFVNVKSIISSKESLYLVAVFNSFVADYFLRKRVSSNVTQFSLHQLPIPSLEASQIYLSNIVTRAAKLICTTPEFDDLAAEVGLGSHANGVTDIAQRAQLRAELDGIIAHLYGLTEAEFTHILSTFPIVPEDTKQAALDEYRKLLPSVGDQAIIALIAQGESAQLEFKSTARWDLREAKKNPVMEEVILKTVAAFLNSDGGTLLIGVADDGTLLGLQPDYQTLKKQDRDGFELWLMGDLLLKALGNDLAPYIAIQVSTLNAKDICQVTLQPAPRPVYCDIKNKNGQPEECFYIRAGNQTKHITKPSEIMHYTQTRWGS